MKQFTKVVVLASLALATAGARSANAACGNLNNDASGLTSTDVTILGQCAAGSCPTLAPPGICGTGNAIDCGDIVEDGVIDSLDVDALRIKVTGGDPLYDICTGPGPDIACGGGTVTLGAAMPFAITSSQTWPKTCSVHIGGLVTVETPPGGPATVITIEAGSIVRGDTGTTTANPAALVFEQGSRIDAVGSPSQPIIFTSAAPAGTRSNGDWGGVVFNGKGNVNGPGCTFTSEGLPFEFGGCEDDYNGGRAVYIRDEFAGLVFSPNNELNLWTMNGLGTQTKMSFIEAVTGKDDCFEWFGGSGNYDHLVAAACADDAFDYQLGFTGTLQYGVYIQNGTVTDSGNDSRGVEADNSEFDPAATPFSNPSFCNVTVVGARNQGPGITNGSDAGMMLRRGTHGQFANMLVTAFADNCVQINDAQTGNDACTAAPALTGNLMLRNSVLFGCGACPGTALNNTFCTGVGIPDGCCTGGGTGTCGQAWEIASNGSTGDSNTAACDQDLASTGINCDAEAWYKLLTGSASDPNLNGVAPTVTFTNAGGNMDQYPPLDNSACTSAATPFLCCTGLNAGTCRALWDPRPVFTGAAPAAFSCPNLNPVLQSTGYLGGIDPAAPCTTTGGAAACGWFGRPWVEFNIN